MHLRNSAIQRQLQRQMIDVQRLYVDSILYAIRGMRVSHKVAGVVFSIIFSKRRASMLLSVEDLSDGATTKRKRGQSGILFVVNYRWNFVFLQRNLF